MDKVVRLTGTGGVEHLSAQDQERKAPGPGEIRIRQEAIGVNFIDIYHRMGLYPLPALPTILGVEGAGVVEEVGAGVTAVSAGDRITYAGAPVGAYATARLLPAARAVRLPDDIPLPLAAASMVRGMTAHMLLTRTYPVGPDSTLLVHAAAGGLGLMLVRWARYLGATVIGTVGSEAKASLARDAGAQHLVVGRQADLVGAIAELTGGRGVDVAYDGIGGDMLRKSLACVRPFGTVASIGQAGGAIPPLDVAEIGPRRALCLARPSVMAYSADPAIYPIAAEAVLQAMRRGIVGTIGGTYPLAEAARAHADLEAGRSSGSLLLIP
ncbi:quinone oxidoreductase [Labrys miyagiensis]